MAGATGTSDKGCRCHGVVLAVRWIGQASRSLATSTNRASLGRSNSRAFAPPPERPEVGGTERSRELEPPCGPSEFFSSSPDEGLQWSSRPVRPALHLSAARPPATGRPQTRLDDAGRDGRAAGPERARAVRTLGVAPTYLRRTKPSTRRASGPELTACRQERARLESDVEAADLSARTVALLLARHTRSRTQAPRWRADARIGLAAHVRWNSAPCVRARDRPWCAAWATWRRSAARVSIACARIGPATAVRARIVACVTGGRTAVVTATARQRAVEVGNGAHVTKSAEARAANSPSGGARIARSRSRAAADSVAAPVACHSGPLTRARHRDGATPAVNGPRASRAGGVGTQHPCAEDRRVGTRHRSAAHRSAGPRAASGGAAGRVAGVATSISTRGQNSTAASVAGNEREDGNGGESRHLGRVAPSAVCQGHAWRDRTSSM